MKTLIAPPRNIRKILIATSNAGKAAEITDVLKPLEIETFCLADLAPQAEVDETGDTFEANAVLKATQYAIRNETVALADDSGLEVDALGGRPGVHSARYGTPGSGYGPKIEQLLGEVASSMDQERTARFAVRNGAVRRRRQCIFYRRRLV